MFLYYYYLCLKYLTINMRAVLAKMQNLDRTAKKVSVLTVESQMSSPQGR